RLPQRTGRPRRHRPRQPRSSFTHEVPRPMRIGIPSETKTLEGRVALVPAAAADLARRGHEVFIQSGAGVNSGFGDEAYVAEGIRVVADAPALYDAAEMI